MMSTRRDEIAQGGGGYLTKCIHQLVLESQLPHKTVNLVFELEILNNELTILWRS